MALPASVTTVAPQPGTAADIGAYSLRSVNDANGNQFMTLNGATSGTVKGIYYNSSRLGYSLISLNAATGAPTGIPDYNGPNTSVGTFPLTGWAVGVGTSPAPTFTAGSGGGSTPSVANNTIMLVY